MSRIVGIIQARMGSTRLPGKVLKQIGDRPMLWHVCERASHASLIDDLFIATSTASVDDAIETFCEEHSINCYRGDEEDVLARFYETASEADADIVVRLTGDCPFLSPPVVDRVIQKYRNSSADYVTNTIKYTQPDGLDVEVFDFQALETAHELATKPAEREHVTPYIRNSPTFKQENVENVIDLSKYGFISEGKILRWTVDYPADLEFIRLVYDHLTTNGHWLFDQHSILELLEREPSLREVNEDR